MKLICAVLLFCASMLSALPADAERVRQLVSELGAGDSSTKWRTAEGVYEHMERNKDYRPFLQSSRLQLESYLPEWEAGADKAVLLLGLLGDNKSLQILRKTKHVAFEIEQRKDPMDDRTGYAPTMRFACLKALLRLRDAAAVVEVRSLLQSADVEKRAKGIDCVVYAECEILVPYLVPLLNDKRDAVNIAPTSSEYFLRTCDVAANALVDTCRIKTAFTTRHDIGYGVRYDDNQIDVIRRAALAWMKKNKQ